MLDQCRPIQIAAIAKGTLEGRRVGFGHLDLIFWDHLLSNLSLLLSLIDDTAIPMTLQALHSYDFFANANGLRVLHLIAHLFVADVVAVRKLNRALRACLLGHAREAGVAEGVTALAYFLRVFVQVHADWARELVVHVVGRYQIITQHILVIFYFCTNNYEILDKVFIFKFKKIIIFFL